MKTTNLLNLKLALSKAYTCQKCGQSSSNAGTRPCPKGGNCVFILHS
jgi:hypothetical protein